MILRRQVKTDKEEKCPKQEELQAYASKKLIGKRNEAIYLHLKYCAKCLRYLADSTRAPSPGDIIQGGRRSRWWRRVLALLRRG